MTSANEQAALAISSHRFDEAIPFVAEDVVWDVVGAGIVNGRDDLVEACRTLQTELIGTTVTFERLRAIVAADSVVVDSVATYTDSAGDESVVASCDIYDFAGDRIVAIRSFNVELDVMIDSDGQEDG